MDKQPTKISYISIACAVFLGNLLTLIVIVLLAHLGIDLLGGF